MKALRQNGFTLYELMITILIMGVIITIGVPNMSDFTANSRMTATANDLQGAFLLGRSEAARTKEEITICASANGTNCASSSFDDGWIVFVDINGDATVDAGDTVMRTFPAINANIDITAEDASGNAADTFTFAESGMGLGNAGALSVARICDSRGNEEVAGGASAARILIITPLGRSTVLRDKAQINAQGGCP